MNVMTYFNAMQPYIQGKSIYQLFPSEYIQNIPFARHPPFHCINCGCGMTPDMIMPPGRITPRAICPHCWEQLTAELTDKCWVCGEDLEDHQLFSQEASPKDIHNRIHDVGQCRDYFSLVSARAMGHSTGILEENHFLANMPGNNPDEVIVVTPWSDQTKRISNNPVIPEIIHDPQETLQDWIDEAGGTHEDKKTIFVPIIRKRQE